MRTRALHITLGLAVACGCLFSCVEKSKRISKADRELIQEIVSKEKPSPQHELDIRFENKIRLIGYDLPEPAMAEERPFKVTWYWQVNEPLGEGWKIFTHLADATNKSRINLDAARPVRRIYPVTEWKRGEYIKDTQEVTLPADWDSEKAIFYLGFWNGPHRLHVTKGPNDGDNRAEALKVPVADGSARAGEPKLERLVARRLTAPLTLDGKLDEPDWQAAQPSGDFVNTMSGEPGAFGAGVRVAYDADKLYLGYQVKDELLKSTHQKRDDHLWEQDTIEVMVDPDGDGQNYFEIQVSPAEVVFDTRYDSRRKPQPFGHVDWNSETEASVAVDGTLNDAEADQGYTVEMAVPWSAFAIPDEPAAPPEQGATWRMNFYVMNLGEERQRAVAWSAPRVADFHVPQRFGRVVFPEAAVPETGAAAPATAPSATSKE